MNDAQMHDWTAQQIMGHFESAINELKAKHVQMACDVDGRSGYAVITDHVVFCALLRDDRIFMELSPSIIEIRRPEKSEFRTAFYYGRLSLFVLVP